MSLALAGANSPGQSITPKDLTYLQKRGRARWLKMRGFGLPGSMSMLLVGEIDVLIFYVRCSPPNRCSRRYVSSQ